MTTKIKKTTTLMKIIRLIKRILNAIDNEEKKTQEKINAEKIKGKPNNRSNKKDW